MSTGLKADSLLAALFGNTRCAVLALFFSRADEAFYLREVIRAAGGGPGAVQRELQRLTATGILRRELRGRHVYYQANRECPIFPELQGLVIKTAGVADVLRTALGSLAERIAVAFLYGSLAKGSAQATSDVDLMVVGDATFAEVVAALGPAQEKLARDINPTVYPPAEFRRKVAQGHHFLTTVLREPKVFLLGGDHELAGLADERLANGPPEQPGRDRRPARHRRA